MTHKKQTYIPQRGRQSSLHIIEEDTTRRDILACGIRNNNTNESGSIGLRGSNHKVKTPFLCLDGLESGLFLLFRSFFRFFLSFLSLSFV